ncbi:endonuclease [Thermanaerovibrio acidaminovorans]|uniref:endonuclease n=1 Tax=Thermanaerovibrio acidaminovorans TaxID=81462 RepID=UPI0024909842|nr:endonuclease [Thermanaerovibrio acidaminovorans]
MGQHGSQGGLDCGIDPGRCKVGVAFGDRELRFSLVIPRDRLGELIRVLTQGDLEPLREYLTYGSIPPEVHLSGSVFVGAGTGSGEVLEELRRAGVRFVPVPEAGSTLMARELYFRLHPPRGLGRLIPRGLRVPPRDVDDLAAWVIVLMGRGT